MICKHGTRFDVWRTLTKQEQDLVPDARFFCKDCEAYIDGHLVVSTGVPKLVVPSEKQPTTEAGVNDDVHTRKNEAQKDLESDFDVAVQSDGFYKKLISRRLYARCYARFRLNLAMGDDRKTSRHLQHALMALREAGFTPQAVDEIQASERRLLESANKVVVE